MNPSRIRSSPYMVWAKSHDGIRYHLASSGMQSLPLKELPVAWEELELTGDSFDGYPPLVEALAKKEHVEPGMVFTTLGTSLANHLALATLLDAQDEILLEDPGYELIESTAAYLGASVRHYHRRPEHGYAIDTDEVARLCTGRTRLIVITNLHNPSSGFVDRETLLRIGAIAEEHGARVLVDEVYLDAAFGMPAQCAARLGPQFLTTNSLTKIYGLSGLRCGWVVAQPDLVRKMYRLNDLFEVNPPHIPEQISAAALRILPQLRAKTKSILEENHASMRAFLGRQDLLEAYDPGFGTMVMCRLRSGSVEKLIELLTKKFETSVAPGRFFGLPEYVRIGLGGEPAMVREGLSRVEQALQELAG